MDRSATAIADARVDEGSPMAGAQVGRGTALLLTLAFCGLLIVPGLQEWRASSSLPGTFRTDVRKYGVQLALNEIERHLVYDSIFANMVRRPYQRLLISWLGQGSRRVLIGADDFWFHRDDPISTAGPGILSERFAQPPPGGREIVEQITHAMTRRLRGRPTAPADAGVPAVFTPALDVLQDFNRKLQAAGVHLSIVIVPAKGTIYPEKLWAGYPTSAGPAVNRDFKSFVDALVHSGVDTIDLSVPFWDAKSGTGAPLFLWHDSHWSPTGVDLGARVTADRVRPFLTLPELTPARTSSAGEMPAPTDLAELLGLRTEDGTTTGRRITLSVVSPAIPSSRVDTPAPVLLFGDSLTGYYESRHAGLRSQLAFQLGAEVRSVVGFGAELPGAISGAFSADAALLDGVQVVILEFHMNQLYSRTFSHVLIPNLPAHEGAR